ncbi:hypothetical protein ACFL1T_03775, partial [Chlamydiota bacterium]
YFTCEDVSRFLHILPQSARVLCSRYVKNGIFIRLKRNYYVLEQKWNVIKNEELYKISNFLQVPSYVSLATALSYYGISTQVQRNYCEAITSRRTRVFIVKDAVFSFYKLKECHYRDFIKNNGFFIATPEKAFIDAVYLYSFGKYKIDFSALDFSKLDKRKLTMIIKKYPQRVKKRVERLCKI